jgi:hypothetical protein
LAGIVVFSNKGWGTSSEEAGVEEYMRSMGHAPLKRTRRKREWADR